MELQTKNSKLQKQVREKIDRINAMDAKIEELLKENKLTQDVISIYSNLFGLRIERVADSEREYKLSCNERIAGSNSAFEARMQGVSKQGHKGAIDEWRVQIDRLPLAGLAGLRAGQVISYPPNAIGEFFKVVREAVRQAGN